MPLNQSDNNIISKNLKKLPPVSKSSNNMRNIISIVIVAFLLILLVFKFGDIFLLSAKKVSISDIVSDAKNHKLSTVTIDSTNTTIIGQLKNNGGQEYANISPAINPIELFTNEGITVSGKDPKFDGQAPGIDLGNLITFAFVIIAGISLFMFFKQMRQSGGGIFSMGESKARLFIGKKQNVTFGSVAGVNEAKQELVEVVDFLKNPKKFTSLGARIPRGVLLIGHPGTGKTLLAKAVAGEAGVPFFSTSGPEFEEMLVGAGASRVRDLFTKARKAAPALIFIDEIDSIGRRRGTVLNSGHTEQTLNQILVEMDGFDSSTNVIVIAATNRPDVLDPALLRPGRFDRTVTLDLPDLEGRKDILAIHAKNKPLASEVSMEKIARRTIGFSGADLENMLNEAAILAAKENKKIITNVELEEAATKVIMGPAKKKADSEEEIKLVAYHEAGHALVSKFLPNSDPVHRISIIPRGMSAGATTYLPEKDKSLSSKSKLETSIVHAMGGYASEKIVFGDVTTGASDDIKKATQMARRMVMSYGMSSELGQVLYANMDEFDDKYGYGDSPKAYSEQTAYKIDQEIRKITDGAYEKASKIITENRDKLDKIVQILIEKEVIEGEEFDELFKDIAKAS